MVIYKAGIAMGNGIKALNDIAESIKKGGFKSKIQTFLDIPVLRQSSLIITKIAKTTSLISKSLYTGGKNFVNFLKKARALVIGISLGLIGITAALFRMSSGAIGRRNLAQKMGLKENSVEALNYANKQSGLNLNFAEMKKAQLDLSSRSVLSSLIGMSGKDFVSLNSDEAAYKLIDVLQKKLKESSDPGVFASFYDNLPGVEAALGLSSADFVQLTKNGRLGEHKKFYEQGLKMYDNVDFGGLTKAEQAFNAVIENLSRFGKFLAGELLPPLTKLIPKLQSVITSFVEWFKSDAGVKVFKEMGEIIQKGVLPVLETLGAVIAKSIEGWAALLSLFEGFGVFDKLKKTTSYIFNGFKKQNEELDTSPVSSILKENSKELKQSLTNPEIKIQNNVNIKTTDPKVQVQISPVSQLINKGRAR